MTPPATVSQLIQRVKSGDVGAAQELIEQHGDVVAGYLRRHLKDQMASDTSDAYQEIMLRVWQKIPNADLRLQTAEQLTAWLTRIAQHEVVTMHRRQRAKIRDIKRNEGDAALIMLATSDTTASQVARGNELKLRLESRMTPSEVKIVDMRLEDHTVAEIAETMGKSIGAITQKLNRLRKRLMQESHVLD